MGQPASPWYRGPTATPRGHQRNFSSRAMAERAATPGPAACFLLPNLKQAGAMRFKSQFRRIEWPSVGAQPHMRQALNPVLSAPKLKVVWSEESVAMTNDSCRGPPVWFPTPTRWLTTACDPSTKGSHTSSDLHGLLIHTWCTDIYSGTYATNIFSFKNIKVFAVCWP